MTESMTKKQEGENTMKNELTTEQAKRTADCNIR